MHLCQTKQDGRVKKNAPICIDGYMMVPKSTQRFHAKKDEEEARAREVPQQVNNPIDQQEAIKESDSTLNLETQVHTRT